MVDEKDSLVDGSSLRISASKWIREALDASLDDDDEKVSLTAPLAVELLGKAVLWGTNPLLLLPTDTKPAALVDLARELDLASPKLRTVGLAEVLTRSAMLMGSFPLSEKQQNLVCDARNGVVHVGSVGAAREVIKHALRAIDAMLLPLNVERTDFYGDSLGVADTLLSEKHTEVQRRVELRMAAATKRMADLEESLGEIAFGEAVAGMEASTRDVVFPEDFGAHFYGSDHECPLCSSRSLLIGRIDLEDEVDYDQERIGPAEYESIPYVYFIPSLYPSAFSCNVCRLVLVSVDELEAASLPTLRLQMSALDLGDDFDAGSVFADLYGPDH